MMYTALTTDKSRLRAFLAQDRLWAAYALGDLEPGLFQHCVWGIASDGGQDVALVLLFNALTPPGLLTFGAPAGVRAILDEALTPERVFFMMGMEHLDVLRHLYEVSALDPMVRMVLDGGSFTPPSDPAPTPAPNKGGGAAGSTLPSLAGKGDGGLGSVRRIMPTDLDALNVLYAGANGPGAFAPFQIEAGVFYGVEVDGRFIAAAGTHLVAPTESVAAIGNVYTHADYRGRGLAQACTGAVVETLLNMGIRDVVLNVDSRNAPAIAAYQRLGFRQYRHFYEAHGQRKTVDSRQ